MGVSSRIAPVAALAAAVVLIGAARNWAQNQVDLQFHAFQDSRGVTVLSPDLNVNRDFTDRTALRFKFGVDAISAASDSCARCHQEGANNGRVVFGASMLRKYGDTKLTLGAEVSRELFYAATTLLSSASRDLHQGNTTVAGGFSYSLNQPQLHPSEQTERQHSFDGFASVTQSWTSTTVTQFGYEVNQINGYQTSPFLRARLNGVFALGESPDRRTRHALTARVRQALPGRNVLEADYRRYHDTWSVDSNAVSLGLSHRFSPALLGGFTYRRYDQTGAYFYAPSYTGSPRYFTGDFRLFPFDSGMYTGRLVVGLKKGFLNLPDGSELTLQYERYRATTSFESGIFTTGVKVPF